MSAKVALNPISMARENVNDKYLTFLLDGRAWGLPVFQIQEIIREMKTLPLPGLPHYVDGIINLRGRIIPIVNLRLRFGHSSVVATERTAVVIVRANGSDGHSLYGLLVDAVEQVLRLRSDVVEPPPAVGSGSASWVGGIARIGEKVMTLLDVSQVVGEMSFTPPAANTSAGESEIDWFETGSVSESSPRLN